MVDTYEGSLGTTVEVLPVDARTNVEFDSTVVYIGSGSDGTAATNDIQFVRSEQDAVNAFGDATTLTDNIVRAQRTGAVSVYGVAAEDDGSGGLDWQAATEEAMRVEPRYVVPLVPEGETNVVSAVQSVLANEANVLNFSRMVTPTPSTPDPSNISSTSPTVEDHRVVEVAPREFTDGTYVASAVAALLSRKPLGGSITFDELPNNVTLATEYRRDEVQDFDGFTAVTRDGVVGEGVTTSSTPAFQDIFQMEIVDAVAVGVDEIAQQYAGSRANTPAQQRALRRDVRAFLGPLTKVRPPLLSDATGGAAFAVEVNARTESEVTLRVGISPVDVMKQVIIELGVGSTVTFEGVDN